VVRRVLALGQRPVPGAAAGGAGPPGRRRARSPPGPLGLAECVGHLVRSLYQGDAHDGAVEGTAPARGGGVRAVVPVGGRAGGDPDPVPAAAAGHGAGQFAAHRRPEAPGALAEEVPARRPGRHPHPPAHRAGRPGALRPRGPVAEKIEARGQAVGDGEERPRLNDPVQELLTTSVNWTDLDPTRESFSEQRNKILDSQKSVALKKTQASSFKVMVDAGHGGKDLGALGPYGLSEKDICLTVGQLVRQSLLRVAKKKDFPLEVQLTRRSDSFLTLRDRVQIANGSGADLFVSIHANASDSPRARGFEVYFLSAEATDAHARGVAATENNAISASAPLKPDVLSILDDVQATRHVAESSRFAETLFRSMARTLKPNGRGVRQAPFTVLAGTLMPALLVEVGYLTNEEEAQLLMKGGYLKRVANAISYGILEFLMVIKSWVETT